MFICLLSIFNSILPSFAVIATCLTINSATSYSPYFTITSATSIVSSDLINHISYYYSCGTGKLLVTTDSSLFQSVSTSSTAKFYFYSPGTKTIAFLCVDNYFVFSFNILSLKLVMTFDTQVITI